VAKIHINIGSNKNRSHNIRLAINELEKHFTDIVVSSIFESPSEGFKGNDFYNLGVNTTTLMTGKEVVTTLRSIETSLGRDRTLPKFSSRIIDLDLVLYDDLVIDTLNVPRDDIIKYAFVLAPLAEISPEEIHPIEKNTYSNLWSTFKSQQDFQLNQYKIERLFE
jgi:2-amino-4-hydroxy-6-hydroxymethyldihydropteridine diphosphokinase